jgi:mannan endo-1,4-beta-mannosidase
MIRRIAIFFFCLLAVHVFGSQAGFVTVKNGQLFRDGKPYRYIGVNYWYGPLLGTGDGDRARLGRELDFLKRQGITNLRVMVGVDGISGNDSHLRFPLQIAEGKYDDKMLDGLDYFMAEAGKRHLSVVLYLTNNWEWTGGYAQYLVWAGKGDLPYPNIAGWNKFSEFISRFYHCDECLQAFKNHCRFIITRINRYTKQPYNREPALMAWEIANEPRPDGVQNTVVFEKWIASMAGFIKSLDKKHLLTTGSEGSMGVEGQIEVWKNIHSIPQIDYATIHIWPKNWGWIDFSAFDKTFAQTKINVQRYVADHAAIADSLHKPLIIEEMGFPRDGHLYAPETPVTARDEYFDMLFSMIGGRYPSLQGCNVWAFGGEGRASGGQYKWKPGDSFVGDPPQEEQGLNTVFDTDETTLRLIGTYNGRFMQIHDK